MAQSLSGEQSAMSFCASASNSHSGPQAPPPTRISGFSSVPISTALTPTLSCVEYNSLVSKIMRDKTSDLGPVTVGLDSGLLNFDKPYIRSKAPHIKKKMSLLARTLSKMVDDKHLLLVCTEPNMYRHHPKCSTVDYTGNEPPWIAQFFQGSLAYPHVEKAMSSISRFLDSDSSSKLPIQVPTVGVSRASSLAISTFKTAQPPSVEAYIDFVHAVVQSGSNTGSSGTIREDQFFPSMLDVPVEEGRKRATLVMRLMRKMVEDNILTRVSAEHGTYVLHPNCRPSEYVADRGLTDISHWLWTFKRGAILDTAAEKAVKNLEKFLSDLSPAEISRINIERDEIPPSSRLEPDLQTQHDDDVYIAEQEGAASSFAKTRTPKRNRQEHKPTDRNSSCGSVQSSVTPILTHTKRSLPREISSLPEHVSGDNLIDSIEIHDRNSTSAIQLREKQAYSDYYQTVPEHQRAVFPAIGPSQFDIFHSNYPNDAFEVIVEKTVGGYTFHIICHDCEGRRVATKYEGSVLKLQLHLNAVLHTSNVMSKLEQMDQMPVETVETKKRMEVYKRVAGQRGYAHRKHATLVSQSLVKDLPANNNPRGSPSAAEVEDFQAMYELPQKAFKYQPPRAGAKAALRDTSSEGSYEPPPAVESGTSQPSQPSQHKPSPPMTSQAPLEAFRREMQDRIEILESSHKRKKAKLDHYGTLLGQTNNNYDDMQQKVSALSSCKDEQVTNLKNVIKDFTVRFEPITERVEQSLQVSQEVAGKVKELTEQVEELVEQVEGVAARDEYHDSRWVELEKARATLAGDIEALSQDKNALDERLGHLENRDYSTNTSTSMDFAAVDARIRELESSKIQALEAQNELEQDNRIMNARFALLEKHDQSLDEAASLLTSMSSRIDALETIRDHTLYTNETLEQNQKMHVNRLEVGKQAKSNLADSEPDSENKSIRPLTDRVAATEEDIIRVFNKCKKTSEWIAYYERITTQSKLHVADLEARLVSETAAREALEEAMEERIEKHMEEMLSASQVREENMMKRMEELLKASQGREDKLAERIKALEKEEKAARHLALLKTYASPRSAAGSESGGGGPSTLKNASWMVPSRPASAASLSNASSPSHNGVASGVVPRVPSKIPPIRPTSTIPSRRGAASGSAPTPSPLCTPIRPPLTASAHMGASAASGRAPRSPSQIAPIRPPLTTSSHMGAATPRPSSQMAGTTKKSKAKDVQTGGHKKQRRF